MRPLRMHCVARPCPVDEPAGASVTPATPPAGSGYGRGRALVVAFGVLASVAAPAAVRSQVVPPGLVPPSPAPDGFVHDGGPVLSADEREALNARIAAVQRATGGDVAVLILRDLQDRAPVDVAVAAYRAWGVGRADSLGSARRDLGALLLVVPKELAPDGRGRCWVTTGRGAEGPLTDADAAAICRDAVVPALRARRYAAAVDSGVARLGAAFVRATAGLPAPGAVGADAAGSDVARPAYAATLPASDGAGGVELAALLGAVAAGGAGGVVLLRRARRRRPRACPNGHGPMTRLDDAADDAALASAQRVEERLGSVDYDVWACGTCDARAVVPYPAWVGRGAAYGACPRCRARTVSSRTRTLREPTTTSTGVEEATRRCLHCHWQEVRRLVLPLVVETASTGSSAGGGSGWSGSSGGGSGGSSGGSSDGFGGSGSTSGGGGGSDY